MKFDNVPVKERGLQMFFGNYFRNRRRNKALKVLTSVLHAKGYQLDYEPDTGSAAYKLGMALWIPVADPSSGEAIDRDKVKAAAEDIRTVSTGIAASFGLTAIGQGPVIGENALVFVYCGFRTTPMK